MRKGVLTIVAVLMLALALVATSSVAFAGFGWDDCPPASSQGVANRSEVATGHVFGLLPPEGANSNATTTNPGNKFK
jgi:hypothetical protein